MLKELIAGVALHSLSIHGASMHFTDYPYPYNERNYGLGVNAELTNTPNTFIHAGGYYNSFRRTTLYVGASRQVCGRTKRNLSGCVGAGVFGFTGYDRSIAPALLPILSVGYRGYQITAIFIPTTSKNPQTLGVSLQIPLRWAW